MNSPWRHCAKWNVRQRKTNIVWAHLYVESRNTELGETESRMKVAKGLGGGGPGEMLVRGYELPNKDE